MPPEVILASGSRWRAAQLRAAGIPFRQIAPDVDEEAAKAQHADPAQLALVLARQKAASVADTEPEAIVIGSDQVAWHRGETLGKPGSPERAASQLARLSGSEHQLLTGLCVRHRGVEHLHLDRTVLAMRPLSADEIERYLTLDEPWDCCGSYRFEERGRWLFDRVSTADASSIEGLPMLAVARLLRRLAGLELIHLA